MATMGVGIFLCSPLLLSGEAAHLTKGSPAVGVHGDSRPLHVDGGFVRITLRHPSEDWLTETRAEGTVIIMACRDSTDNPRKSFFRDGTRLLDARQTALEGLFLFAATGPVVYPFGESVA